MKTINLTDKWDFSRQKEVCRVMQVTLNLSREDICEALRHDYVAINGVVFEAPKEQLLSMLRIGIFNTEYKLELKEVL